MRRVLGAGLLALVLAACGAASAPSQPQTGPTSAPATPPAGGTAAPTVDYDY